MGTRSQLLHPRYFGDSTQAGARADIVILSIYQGHEIYFN